jgi:hypothetical protein
MKAEASAFAPLPVRLASACAYFVVGRLGLACFVMPWADRASPEVATAAALAGALYVVHYLLESTLAWRKMTTMHAWKPDDVIKHHLTVGLVLLPACLLCAVCMPSDWCAMLESHPPAVAVISSASVTGFNEGLFVLRSFLPLHIANGPVTKYFQSCCTLATLLQNVPMTQAGCVLGAYTLLPQLLRCAAEGGGSRCRTDFRTLLSLCLVVTYTAGPLFFLFVQRRYLPANVRRVFEPLLKNSEKRR